MAEQNAQDISHRIQSGKIPRYMCRVGGIRFIQFSELHKLKTVKLLMGRNGIRPRLFQKVKSESLTPLHIQEVKSESLTPSSQEGGDVERGDAG